MKKKEIPAKSGNIIENTRVNGLLRTGFERITQAKIRHLAIVVPVLPPCRRGGIPALRGSSSKGEWG
jgi:hypothetical protein